MSAIRWRWYTNHNVWSILVEPDFYYTHLFTWTIFFLLLSTSVAVNQQPFTPLSLSLSLPVKCHSQWILVMEWKACKTLFVVLFCPFDVLRNETKKKLKEFNECLLNSRKGKFLIMDGAGDWTVGDWWTKQLVESCLQLLHLLSQSSSSRATYSGDCWWWRMT